MAGTDKSQPLSLEPSPVIILCEPQLGENIGTTARAMANFGLWDLRLVNPRDGWPNPKAVSAAAKADHVIDRTRVFESVESAIADLSLVFATTARKREMLKPVIGPDEAAGRMATHIAGGAGAGLLFGRERWGLNNNEVALSDAIVTLPVEAAFASLNIAQAVLVLAYEWRRAGTNAELLFGQDDVPLARKEELVGMFEQLEAALDESGFFKTAEKRPTVVANLRAMLGRSGFSEQEVRTLRGVIASLVRRHEQQNPNRARSEK